MAVPAQNDPFGPAAIVLGCTAGAVIGGILDGLLSDRGGGWFSAFGAVFGLMLGGLIGAGVWEFGRPFVRLIEALMPGGAPPPAPAAAGQAAPLPLDPNRPSMVGRALQGILAFAALVGGIVLLLVLARPVATLVGLPMFMVLPVGVVLVGSAVLAAWRAGAVLAVHFDLTAE